MEHSALNVAHEKQRRADVLLREKRFEEAADCHEKVAELLTEAHSQLSGSFIGKTQPEISNQESGSSSLSTNSISALESLMLQRDFHKRQAAVVRMKQVQYEDYKNTLENQQRSLLRKQISKHQEKENINNIAPDKYDDSLRQAIYRTIEEQDNLLSLMSLPDDDQAFKHPKDTGTVIEELRTVNSQLRFLVESLLSQVEAKDQEVIRLTQLLRNVTVQEGDEITSCESHSLRLAPLPPLAPLEMPLFDFSSS